MTTVRTIAELRRCREELRGQRVAFVPTMGALHAGHRALLRAARIEANVLIASIFVNPAQFNDPRDLASYPRSEQADASLAASAGVDLLFVPEVREIYPEDHATAIEMGGPARGYEGAYRPGHFNGVALVCLKLFNLVQPDLVYFGQKDAQQVAVLQQLVRDLNLPIALHVVPTVRADDGLALSSRNVRLSAAERARAAAIPRALRAGLAAWHRDADPVAAARAELGDLDVEYAEIARFDGAPTLVLAVRVGATRLIDNVPLNQPALAAL